MAMKLKYSARIWLLFCWLMLPAGAWAEAQEQFISVLSYRTGALAHAGAATFGGWIDYMEWVNSRGGINGVKIAWEECETSYETRRGVECYERLKLKSKSRGSMIHPLSTGIAYELIDRVTADKVPLVTIGYGRSDAVDGRYFPYVFPLVTTYQMQASAMLAFIEQRSKVKNTGKPAGKSKGKAGLATLGGKRIAFVYHDSPFGKEPLQVLRAEAAVKKFRLIEIPVAPPGMDQREHWQKVQKEKADYVIFWGWGDMNSAGLKAAASAGFPRDRIIGVWWAGAEEDTLPAGDDAKGYIAANFGISGKEIPLTQDILKSLYTQGKGNVKDIANVGSVLYSRGLLHGVITVEAIRTAQTRFGKRPMTGEEIQWGLEHLKINQKRLRELGAEGMMPDTVVTCADHEGSGMVMFQQWDGVRWNKISDYIEGNRPLVRKILGESSAQYAAEKRLEPRDCEAIDKQTGKRKRRSSKR